MVIWICSQIILEKLKVFIFKTGPMSHQREECSNLMVRTQIYFISSWQTSKLELELSQVLRFEQRHSLLNTSITIHREDSVRPKLSITHTVLSLLAILHLFSNQECHSMGLYHSDTVIRWLFQKKCSVGQSLN